MRLFRHFRRKSRHEYEEGPWQRFFRIVIIVLMFGAVLLGFWMNSERQLNKIRRLSPNRIDSTNTLRKEQLQVPAGYSEHIQELYGIFMPFSICNHEFSIKVHPEMEMESLIS